MDFACADRAAGGREARDRVETRWCGGLIRTRPGQGAAPYGPHAAGVLGPRLGDAFVGQRRLDPRDGAHGRAVWRLLDRPTRARCTTGPCRAPAGSPSWRGCSRPRASPSGRGQSPASGPGWAAALLLVALVSFLDDRGEVGWPTGSPPTSAPRCSCARRPALAGRRATRRRAGPCRAGGARGCPVRRLDDQPLQLHGRHGRLRRRAWRCSASPPWRARLAGGRLEFALANGADRGSPLGFLLGNFPPARIFLGDLGSASLGFLAAAASLIGSDRGLFPLWVAWLAFSPFIVDATWTLFAGWRGASGCGRPHRSHHYQRLVLAGWGHRRTVLRPTC
jgi:hypothetical protein